VTIPDARRPSTGARFVRVEVVSGPLLLLAAVVAVVWANSRWDGGYADVWNGRPRELVNEALMTVFFFVVGMEIKRESVEGALRDRRAVVLPVVAAAGGMLVPALIYTAINVGGSGGRGWGVPIATDVAFALGVAGLLGTRLPPAIRVVLLTLAIVDDIGAIVVIALAYSHEVNPLWLVAGAFDLALLAVTPAIWRQTLPAIVLWGGSLWWCLHAGGVHATLAGAALGLAVPAGSLGCDRWISRFHPLSSLLVLPLFALANAGVRITAGSLTHPTRIALGVAAGLVVGKLVGVVAFSSLAVRVGWARLPDGVRWVHIAGMGALAGIGFTVSLFVTGLAFDAEPLRRQATLGTFAGSIVSALVAVAIFGGARRRGPISRR
jgi:NhaA family Na+:H+ antiporter